MLEGCCGNGEAGSDYEEGIEKVQYQKRDVTVEVGEHVPLGERLDFRELPKQLVLEYIRSMKVAPVSVGTVSQTLYILHDQYHFFFYPTVCIIISHLFQYIYIYVYTFNMPTSYH